MWLLRKAQVIKASWAGKLEIATKGFHRDCGKAGRRLGTCDRRKHGILRVASVPLVQKHDDSRQHVRTPEHFHWR